jgi:nucleotide-binding universal stress UspA family protein
LKHILCTTDGSEPSRNAVALAARLARAMGSRLTILAIRPYVIGRHGVHEVWTHEELEQALATAQKAAAEAGFDHPEMRQDRARDIAHAIVTYAEQNGVDHIVMGSTGKGGMKQFLLGSVSSEVLRKSFCPVTIVH